MIAVVTAQLMLILLTPIVNRISGSETRVSRTSQLFNGSGPRFREAGRDECSELRGRELQIRGEFMQASTTAWQNLFQTANANRGVRVEIDEHGRIALIVGNSDGTFESLNHYLEIEIEKTYRFEVRVTERQLEFTLDDATVSKIASTEPICDSYKISSGFDDSRKFEGSVTATFELREIEESRYGLDGRWLVALNFIFFLLCAALWTRAERLRDQ